MDYKIDLVELNNLLNPENDEINVYIIKIKIRKIYLIKSIIQV